MPIKVDVSNFYKESIGPFGIDEALRRQALPEWRSIYRRVQDQHQHHHIAFMDLPYALPSKIQEIEDMVNAVKEECDTLVVVGIGGSLLGSQMLYDVMKKSAVMSKKHSYSRVFFLGDTTDPTPLINLLNRLDLGKTAFNIVSKSGTTLETIALFEIIRERYRKEFGEDYVKYFVFTTETTRNYLFQTALDLEIPVFGMREDLGGRFSVLSPVGLFPAAFAGINIKKILDGAAMMDARLKEQGSDNDAIEYAWLHYIAAKDQNRLMNILFTYSSALEQFGWWWRQLWAESLGKRYTLTGQEVRVGLTPIVANGPADQHSQLQLYSEGPLDKTFTFIGVDEFEQDVEIEKMEEATLNFIGGSRLSDILAAEREATQSVLTETGQLNASIIVPRVDEEYLGALIYFFEMVTIYVAGFYNINPFDQPGVESSKVKIKQLLKKHD